jgi:hypothetical protein
MPPGWQAAGVVAGPGTVAFIGIEIDANFQCRRRRVEQTQTDQRIVERQVAGRVLALDP